MSASEHQRYRFGPLERRGLIGSLRPAQVIVIAVSLTGGVILMRALSSGAGVVAALALALARGRVLLLADQRPLGRGVAADRRAGTRARHALGRHVQLSPAPQAGARLDGGRTAGAGRRAPRGRRATSSCSPRRSTARRSAWSRIAARASYTAVLAVQGDVVRAPRPRRAGEHGRPAGAACSRVSPARASPVSRIQWVERTVPADGDEIGRYLGEAWDRDAVAARLARRCSPTSS